jgi:hypothetical protein
LEAVGTAELLAKPFDPTGGIDELLLTGEEGMAHVADIDVDLGQGAAGDKRIAAGTVCRTGLIPGMNLGFHDKLLPCL